MKRLIPLVALLLLLPVSLIHSQRLGPRLLVVEPDFDFGHMPQHAKVSHTYWIDNLGTDTLRIFNIKPGCGCTDAPLERFTAAPNDSLPIELVFDSGRRSRTQLKNTVVTCNDPAKSRFNLQLSAWVYKDGDTTSPIVITRNERLKFSDQDLGKTFVVEFENRSKEDLTVSLVDHPAELVSVRVPSEAIGPGKRGEIAVTVNSEVERSNYQKSFTIELADEGSTRFTIPLRMAEDVSSLGR
jgi:hypothetical protein